MRLEHGESAIGPRRAVVKAANYSAASPPAPRTLATPRGLAGDRR
jgi:hypothetical protein